LIATLNSTIDFTSLPLYPSLIGCRLFVPSQPAER
jgi:hypothetical protein